MCLPRSLKGRQTRRRSGTALSTGWMASHLRSLRWVLGHCIGVGWGSVTTAHIFGKYCAFFSLCFLGIFSVNAVFSITMCMFSVNTLHFLCRGCASLCVSFGWRDDSKQAVCFSSVIQDGNRQYVSFLFGVIQLVWLARWQKAVCFIPVWCYPACVVGKQYVSFLFGVIQHVWLASGLFQFCLVLFSVCVWQAVCFIPVWCYRACVVGKQYVSFLFGVIQHVWLASSLFQFCLVLFSYCSCQENSSQYLCVWSVDSTGWLVASMKTWGCLTATSSSLSILTSLLGKLRWVLDVMQQSDCFRQTGLLFLTCWLHVGSVV